jgi:parallel beta-helix repeat protein
MERKHINHVLIAAAMITGIAAGIAGVKPVAAGPFIPVSACLTINASGNYKLVSNIGSAGTCIVIQASNVVFDLNSLAIGGGGSGRGILILHGANNVVVTTGQIKNAATGVDDRGSNTQLLHLQLFNDRRGVVLNGGTTSTVKNDKFPSIHLVSVLLNATTGATVTQNTLTGSGGYGVWVRGSSNFAVTNNQISQTAAAGIIVACTTGGIKNVLTCKASQGGVIGGNRLVLMPHLGIAIDRGNGHIHVSGNNVSLSGKYDLFDSNLACGTDTWTGDTYTKHNRPCVN